MNQTRRLLIILFLFIFNSCKDNVNEPTIETSDLINVNLIFPANDSFITKPISFVAEVESENPIKEVQFSIDYKLVGTVVDSPYIFTPDLYNWADNKIHKIKCTAFDTKGNMNFMENSVTILENVKFYIRLIEPSFNDTIRYNNEVNFSWYQSLNRIFTIQISIDNNFIKVVQSHESSNYSFTSLPLDKGDYYWRVGYFSPEILDSVWSLNQPFTISGPKAPNMISHENDSVYSYKNESIFKWGKSEFSIGYQLQIQDLNNPMGLFLDEIVNDTAFNSSLELGAYSLKIRAKNEKQIWGEWSNELSFGNGVFMKRYEIDNGSNIVDCVELADSGLVIICYNSISNETFIFKTNSIGQILWNQVFPNLHLTDVINGIDGGFLAINNWREIKKFDNEANLQWSYSNEDSESIVLSSVSISNDQNYLLVGQQSFGGIYNKKIYISKITQNGNLDWEYTRGRSSCEGITALEINNNYIVVGREIDSTIHFPSIYHLELDPNGNIVSENSFLQLVSVPQMDYTTFDAVLINDNIYNVGSFATHYGIFVHKSNIYGDEFWNNHILSSVPSSAKRVVESYDNNLIITGHDHTDRAKGIYSFKISSDGNLIWEKHFSGVGGSEIIKTLDLGYVILGFDQDFSAGLTNYFHIIKINKLGETFDKL